MNTSNLKFAAGLGLLAAGIAIGWGLSNWKPADHAAHTASAPAASAIAAASATDAKQERKVMYWYDPMVPMQKFDKPGKSPFMDMQLVPKYADESGGTGAGAGPAVTVSSQAVQSLGVRLATVEKISVAATIDAVGSLQLSERDVSIVQARSGGFVERVYAHAPGDVIAAGAPLVDLLLPEWVAAQREFLAVKAMGDEAITAAARQRLALLGMPAAVIAQVERSGQTQGGYTVTAPSGGVIAELMVRAGMTVSQGVSLARINGLGTVWLEVAVPEAQAGAVRPGQGAEARLVAYPGEVFQGKVAAILPESSRDSRTLRVRIELPNPAQRLKAGMFAQVALRGPQTEAIVVPSEAVIRTGKRAVVYVVDAPGRYRPVEIGIGAEVGGNLVVQRGLESGQQVVASSQFLIDSEASMRGVVPAAPMANTASATPAVMAPVAAKTEQSPSYDTTGTVVELSGDSVMLSHEAIPALKWPPMTMGFKLADPRLKDALRPKQSVEFSFTRRGDDYVITAVKPAATAGRRP